MESGDTLGLVEFAVLESVSRGALRSRRTAQQIDVLRGQPAGEAILHDVLRRCERGGLLRSSRDSSGRRYEVTAAGRIRLRTDRRFRAAVVRMLARSRFYERAGDLTASPPSLGLLIGQASTRRRRALSARDPRLSGRLWHHGRLAGREHFADRAFRAVADASRDARGGVSAGLAFCVTKARRQPGV